MAGTPLSAIGTVSQKSFPARREIFSSRLRDPSTFSIFALMLVCVFCVAEDNNSVFANF